VSIASPAQPSSKFTPDPNDVYPLHLFVGDFTTWVADAHDVQYCFVIGAGASRSSGIQTGAALVDRWLEVRFDQERPGVPQSDLPGWAEDTFKMWDGFSWATRAAFYGRIYEWFYRDTATGQAALRSLMRDKSPSFGYTILASILARTSHKVVLTTNFDNLVQDAIMLYSPSCNTFVCHGENDARFLAGHAKRVRIVKLHGDIDRETYNAASQIQRLHPNWDAALRGVFTDHTPIFLGYGGNDPGFMRFLSETLDPGQFRARPIWAYRVDSGALETESAAGSVPPGFPDTALVRRFMDRHKGLWLPTPGFDELMLLLGHALKFESLAPRMRAEADRRVKDYERTLSETMKAVRLVPSAPWCPQLSHLASAAEAGLLGAVGRRTWDEWRVALRAAASRQDEARLYQDALRELGESPELKADYARFLAEVTPNAPEVEALIEEARLLGERGAGHDSPTPLAVKHALGAVRYSQGKLTEAQGIAEEVLRARRAVLGPEHPDTLRTATLLGAVLFDQKKYAESERLFRHTLDVHERTLGPEHGDTLWSMNNLANSLAAQTHYAEAETLLRRVVEERIRTLGADHRVTWASVSNLANVLGYRGDYAEAEQLLRRVLDGYGRVVGPENPETLATAVNLGVVLNKQGRPTEARALIQPVVDVFERTLGTDHPSTLWAREELDSLPPP
jgi:tetratricopeptide (TPR) repeat protein